MKPESQRSSLSLQAFPVQSRAEQTLFDADSWFTSPGNIRLCRYKYLRVPMQIAPFHSINRQRQCIDSNVRIPTENPSLPTSTCYMDADRP